MNKKYKFSRLIYCLFFLAIIPYDTKKLFLNNFSVVSIMFIYLIRLAIVIYTFLIIVQKNKLAKYQKNVLNRTTIYFSSIIVINIIAFLLNNLENDYLILLERILSIICVYSSLILIIYNSEHTEEIIKGLKISTLFLVMFSIILYVCFPQIGKYYAGNNEYTFLGIANNRNGYIEFAIALVLSIFYLGKKKIHIIDKGIMLLTLITIYLTHSATSIISTIIIIFLATYIYISNKKINFNKIFLGVFIVWILFIAIFSLNSNFEFLGKIFNKSSTLSGRTIIWSKAIEYIKIHPIIGYGYDNKVIANTASKIFARYFATNDTHNSILYLWLSSGILGVIITVVYFYKSLKGKYDFNDYKINNYYILLYILLAFIRGLTESCLHYSHALLYIMITIISIENEKIKLKEKKSERNNII